MTDMETDLIMYKAENNQLKKEIKELKILLNEANIKYETITKMNEKNEKIINELQKELEGYKKNTNIRNY